MCQSIDTALHYFINVTKSFDQPAQRRIKYLMTIIDIMKAAWIIQTVKSSQEFQTAAQSRSENTFEQQLDQWGMTIERFLDKLEQVTYLPHDRDIEAACSLLLT